MKETKYKADPKQPYGLHDCKIDCMEIADRIVLIRELPILTGQEKPGMK